MNIHEYQAKELLKKYSAPVSNGVTIFRLEDISDKINQLNTKQFVLKAQIHAGGRGKAGGVKLVKNLDELKKEAQEMFGKVLVTHQTGPEGKKVKTLYIEEASEILKEFYLSCLVDRESSKITFISSTEGGMDIEKVAKDTPEKIITTKAELNDEINDDNILKIIKPFNLNNEQMQEAKKLLQEIDKNELSELAKEASDVAKEVSDVAKEVSDEVKDSESFSILDKKIGSTDITLKQLIGASRNR